MAAPFGIAAVPGVAQVGSGIPNVALPQPLSVAPAPAPAPAPVVIPNAPRGAAAPVPQQTQQTQPQANAGNLNLPAGVQPIVAADGTLLDPSVVNLAKAIKQTESSGNYNAKGGSGEFGAYQWMPGNFQANAQKYLGISNADPSDPVLQDKVAYAEILSMKQAGLTPQQIASAWNAGQANKNAYTGTFASGAPSVGTNAEGVKYNVPAYVSKVMTNFQKVKASSPAPAPATPPAAASSPLAANFATTPSADQQSAAQTGALFPANTNTSSEGFLGKVGEVLKTVGNIPTSAFNFVKGAVSTLNPVNIAKTVAQIPAAVTGLESDVAAQNQSQQGVATENNALIQQYQQMKANGQDTTQVEAFMKQNGIDPSQVQVAPAPQTALKAAVGATPGAVAQSLIPDAVRATGQIIKGMATGNGDLEDASIQRAERDITNDPVGSILPILIALESGAEGVDNITKNAAEGGMADYVGNISDNIKNGVPIPTATGTDLSGALDRGVSKVAGTVIDPLSTVFGKAKGVASSVADEGAGFVKNQISHAVGIEPSTIDQVVNNPQSFTKDAMANTDRAGLAQEVQTALQKRSADLGVTPESLGSEVQSALGKRSAALEDTGSAYKPIRESTNTVKIDPSYLDKTIKDTTGLDIKKGEVQTSGAASIRDPKDVNALQNLYDTWKPTFKSGEMTNSEFLNFRSDLGKLSKFDREVTKSAPLENLSKKMYSDFNTAYRPQISGLSALDESFSTQVQELNTLSKGLVDSNGKLTDSGLNKIVKAKAKSPALMEQLEKISPGIGAKIEAIQELKTLGKGVIDDNGNLTETAMNKIANATGKGKDLLLDRLEQAAPGITKRIQITKAVEDIQNAAGNKVGTYNRSLDSGLAAAGGYVFGGIHGAIIGAVVEKILSAPNTAVAILRQYGMLKDSAAVGAVMKSLKSAADKTKVDSLTDVTGGSALKKAAIPVTVFGRQAQQQAVAMQ